MIVYIGKVMIVYTTQERGFQEIETSSFTRRILDENITKEVLLMLARPRPENSNHRYAIFKT